VPGTTAADLVAVVRVHADRVHDWVRRLGCEPTTAARVVRASALELVDAAARGQAGDDPVGWWFARARSDGGCEVDEHDGLPLGTGPLAADAAQAGLAGAVEEAPEDERAALLLRDAYDLPTSTVAAALGTDPDTALAHVGTARLALLSRLGRPAPVAPDHPGAGPAALARAAGSGPSSPGDATARRHAQVCSLCGPALEAQAQARRLLSGLSVDALPDVAREELLESVASRAAGALPADPVPAARTRPLLTPLTGAAALAVALALGLLIGVLLGHGRPDTALPVTVLPPVTAPPLPTLSPVPRRTVPAGPVVVVDPARGPEGQRLTVTGQGWPPGAQLSLRYLGATSRTTGSAAAVRVDADGAFVARLATADPRHELGPHTVEVAGAGTRASAPYVVVPQVR
jgi:DNA-directed RNA polymerase specialized sigma24 family protein